MTFLFDGNRVDDNSKTTFVSTGEANDEELRAVYESTEHMECELVIHMSISFLTNTQEIKE